jgi:hypothetical protein
MSVSFSAKMELHKIGPRKLMLRLRFFIEWNNDLAALADCSDCCGAGGPMTAIPADLELIKKKYF